MMPIFPKKKHLFVILPLVVVCMTALAVYHTILGCLSLFRKLPSMFRHREVFPYDTSIRIDPTSVLPVELMQQIHSHLPPGDYLTIKFVSRSFHASTLLASGRDLRGFKGTRDYDDPDHDFYLDAVINLEVCTRYPLELLTCCHCGKRAGNELNGFSDEQFVQADECRGCLKCRKPCSCTIRGVQVARCHWCDTYVTGVEDEFGQWKAEPVHWCVQRRGVRAPWV